MDIAASKRARKAGLNRASIVPSEVRFRSWILERYRDEACKRPSATILRVAIITSAHRGSRNETMKEC